MTDFSMESQLSFSKSSLKSASRQLERELGGVSIGVETGGTTASRMGNGSGGLGSTASSAVGTKLSGVTATVEEMVGLGTDRNTILSDMLEAVERGGGGGGDGGGGLVGGLLSGVGLRGVLGSVGISALISKGATITAGALISAKASISAGALIASAATVAPAALIASAAVVSAGVLIADKPVISAAALIGGTAAITAGVLIGSPAVIGAGALVATAATITAADVVAEKIAASDLVDDPGQDPVSESTAGNPDREKPDIFGSTNRPNRHNLEGYFQGNDVPTSSEAATQPDADDIAPDFDSDAWIQETKESVENMPDVNASESGSGSTNQAQNQSGGNTTIEHSPTYEVETRDLERKVDEDMRDLKQRLRDLERAFE